MIATQKNDLECMNLLINAGADVNAIEASNFPHAGNPVLRFALDNNSVEAV